MMSIIVAEFDARLIASQIEDVSDSFDSPSNNICILLPSAQVRLSGTSEKQDVPIHRFHPQITKV